MLAKEEKAMLRDVYARDVWKKDGRMADYCAGKAAQLVALPSGGFIQIDKQGIEKRFCFGESGYDYEDAAALAQHARTSEDYFMRENMKEFNSWIESINDQFSMHEEAPFLPSAVLLIAEHPYISQAEDSPLKGLTFFRGWEFIEAFGGCVRVADTIGQRVTIRGSLYRIPRRDDLEAILAGYKAAAREHEKKIAAYLKKYGLQHVHSWTYWRDA